MTTKLTVTMTVTPKICMEEERCRPRAHSKEAEK